MKKLLLALLLVSNISYADIAATMRNKAGGYIALTSDVCSTSDTMFQAYSSMPNHSTMWGCWYSDTINVHIRWSDGDYRTYPLENWSVDQAVVRKMKRAYQGGSSI